MQMKMKVTVTQQMLAMLNEVLSMPLTTLLMKMTKRLSNLLIDEWMRKNSSWTH